MEDWETCEAVERHPDRVSGVWVFRGTRVPVAALFENLRDGASIDQFLEWFPGVERSQIDAVLEYEATALRGYAAAEAACPYSEGEFEQFRGESGGRSLNEIWNSLRHQ